MSYYSDSLQFCAGCFTSSIRLWEYQEPYSCHLQINVGEDEWALLKLIIFIKKLNYLAFLNWTPFLIFSLYMYVVIISLITIVCLWIIIWINFDVFKLLCIIINIIFFTGSFFVVWWQDVYLKDYPQGNVIKNDM